MATLAPSQLDSVASAHASARGKRKKLSLYGIGLALVALGAAALFAYGFDYTARTADRVHPEFRALHTSGRPATYGVLRAACSFQLRYCRRSCARARGTMHAGHAQCVGLGSTR